jgi:hypothetical protein
LFSNWHAVFSTILGLLSAELYRARETQVSQRVL